MKFWISLVNTLEIDQFIEIAKKAEELGYEGITVADHLIYPEKVDTKYPYSDDGKIWWPNNNPWTDPWVTLTAMGVATKELKLATNIYLAALRDPFTVARATSAAAIFTNNRVRCGVGAGMMKEEFDLVGVDFKARGRVLDEVIECMHKLHSGEPVSYNGEFFNFNDAIMSPAPTKKIPVWVGGVSKPALRRAAANDGWMSVPMKNEPLAKMLSELFELRKACGNYDAPFDAMLSPLELIRQDFVDTLDPAGTYHTNVLPWTPSPWGKAFWVEDGEDHSLFEVKCKSMERFRDMMHKFGMWEG